MGGETGCGAAFFFFCCVSNENIFKGREGRKRTNGRTKREKKQTWEEREREGEKQKLIKVPR